MSSTSIPAGLPAPGAQPAKHDLGVIKDARRRQRRRRVTAGMVVLATAAAGGWAAGGGLWRGPETDTSTAPPGPGVYASPATVFAQPPSMGVACGAPTITACDRVGLTVWLARPAAVTATLAGQHSALNDRHWSYVIAPTLQTGLGVGDTYVYTGFLHPAGLVTGRHAKRSSGDPVRGPSMLTPLVRFRIDYGHGDVVFTEQHVLLRAGFG